MEKEDALRELVQRYKANCDKVPIQMLKTRYAAAFRKLRLDMLEAAFGIVFEPPSWMRSLGPTMEAWRLMLAVFNRQVSEGGHQAGLRRALFEHRDADEAIAAAGEMNRENLRAWDAYLEATSRHVAWEQEDGSLSEPRRYSPLLIAVRDEGEWRRLRAGEPVPDFGGLLDDALAGLRPWMPERREHGPDKGGRGM